MTPEDRIMVEKLRNAVKDNLTPFYDTDFNLLRWLQGHNYDMDIIVPKLRYHLRFRQSCWDLDNMHKCPRDHVIQAHWPDGLTGYSGKENNAIVIIEQAGAVDYRGMLLTYSLVESVKSRMKDLELMLKEVMKHEEKT
uniref:Uncharacterized protein n=1 Tax=Plectus sambesii TaxID=2011161 RepID=A0A914X3W8_9BILA